MSIERRMIESLCRDERFMAAMRKVIQALNDIVRKLAPLLDLLAKVRARARWYEARQAARLLAHHPDLAALDRWLDWFYLDPVAALQCPPYRSGD